MANLSFDNLRARRRNDMLHCSDSRAPNWGIVASLLINAVVWCVVLHLLGVLH